MTSKAQNQFFASSGRNAMSEENQIEGRISSRRKARLAASESWEFRAIVAVSFAACLIGTTVRRLSGRAPKGQSYMSCISDARSAAYAAAGYAFHS
jgi:hypothetical protein